MNVEGRKKHAYIQKDEQTEKNVAGEKNAKHGIKNQCRKLEQTKGKLC